MRDGWALLAFVTAQRGLELLWARRNERRLRARGAVEAGASHYPLIVLLHGAWLLALWIRGWNRALVWPWVGLFVLLQFARAWVLLTLGGRWTTRVLVVPGETLARKGPYRFLKHPNYLIVALEIPTVALAVGRVKLAVMFGIVNLAVLALRIRVEDQALANLTAP